MMNQRIETGLLISEIIKSNTDDAYIKNFIKYLISKIVDEGYFKSSLFHQLVRLAEIKPGGHHDGDEEDATTYADQAPENSN